MLDKDLRLQNYDLLISGEDEILKDGPPGPILVEFELDFGLVSPAECGLGFVVVCYQFILFRFKIGFLTV